MTTWEIIGAIMVACPIVFAWAVMLAQEGLKVFLFVLGVFAWIVLGCALASGVLP